MKKKENLEQLMYLLGKYSRSNTPHKDYGIAVWRHRQIQAALEFSQIRNQRAYSAMYIVQ